MDTSIELKVTGRKTMSFHWLNPLVIVLKVIEKPLLLPIGSSEVDGQHATAWLQNPSHFNGQLLTCGQMVKHYGGQHHNLERPNSNQLMLFKIQPNTSGTSLEFQVHCSYEFRHQTHLEMATRGYGDCHRGQGSR